MYNLDMPGFDGGLEVAEAEKDKGERTEREWRTPEGWTVLRHGTNLAREEWKGKGHLLDQETLIIATGYPGLSCIDSEEARNNNEAARLMGIKDRGYDTTWGYSTLGGAEGGVPAEIQVAIPKMHDRLRPADAGKLEQKYSEHFGARWGEIKGFLNKTFWKLNQQHPIVPNGTVLAKVDEVVENGRRVVRYVPEQVLEIYDKENSR